MIPTPHTDALPAPKHVLIETTTRCNLRCKQCARMIGKYALADMTLDTFHLIEPLFATAEQVALYGHGETLLYRHFFAMLAELKQYPPMVYVTTNGTLLTEAVSERLVELGLDKLAVSLDAATPALFNEIRRGADFDQVIRNIRTLNAIKKRYRRDDQPILSIMYCAMHSNIQELPKLVRLADELNMTHGVAVMNIYEYEQTKGENILRYPELAARYLREAHILAAKLAIPFDCEESFTVPLPPVQLSIGDRISRNDREFRRSFNRTTLLKTKMARILTKAHRFFNKQASHLHPPPSSPSHTIRVKKCRDPWEFMFIDVHGDVRVCCGSHRIMGNVNREDVLSIWNNQAYQEFRARILTTAPPEECHTCLFKGWHDVPG